MGTGVEVGADVVVGSAVGTGVGSSETAVVPQPYRQLNSSMLIKTEIRFFFINNTFGFVWFATQIICLGILFMIYCIITFSWLQQKTGRPSFYLTCERLDSCFRNHTVNKKKNDLNP